MMTMMMMVMVMMMMVIGLSNLGVGNYRCVPLVAHSVAGKWDTASALKKEKSKAKIDLT